MRTTPSPIGKAVSLFPEPATGNREQSSVRCSGPSVGDFVPPTEQPSNPPVASARFGWSPATKFRATEGSVELKNAENLNRQPRNNLIKVRVNKIT